MGGTRAASARHAASPLAPLPPPARQGWFTWREIFHLLDIICCCAILFPIVWSIKHLREAANTDGKARGGRRAPPARAAPRTPRPALFDRHVCSHTHGPAPHAPPAQAARNLQKLTLFRQFYVMVRRQPRAPTARTTHRPTASRPCVTSTRALLPAGRQVVSYIYFTRIVVYLLKSTTPYQYLWLSDCAGEMATLAFYCFTGFKFRPVQQNPFFHLEMDELDEAEQELVRREQLENAVQDAVGKEAGRDA